MFLTKKPTAATSGKKTNKRKTGLGRTEPRTKETRICDRVNPDGSHTIYTALGDSNPCPLGGLPRTVNQVALNGTKAKTHPARRRTTATRVCRRVIHVDGLTASGKLRKGYHYEKGGVIVKNKVKAPAKRKPTAPKPAARKR